VDQAGLREFEQRCIQEEPAECVAACPLHVDARSFAIEVARGAWDEAWKILRKTMPLPSVLGRICDHPCEDRCRRRERGGSIRIGALEQACVQMPSPEQRVLSLPRRDKRVGVMGTGLASLTVAWDLARKGYPISVFGPSGRVGGLLLQYPEDVLPRDAIDGEIAILRRIGVEFRLGETPGLDVLRGGFDAVFFGLDAGLAEPETLESGPDGRPRFDRSTMQAGLDGIFLGGERPADGAMSPVGWALDGRRAAVSIDRLLQGASLHAGREKEGPQSTRLFVSLTGVESAPPVAPAEQEAARCLRCECLECVKVCEYLEHFGSYPRRYAREVYNNGAIVKGDHKSNLFIDSCMLCGLCTTVCPEQFSMPDLCLGARREMVRGGKMPPSAHEFALEDYRWSHSDAFALSRHEPGHDRSAYAFFPGCQLAGSNPGQVELVYEHLRSRLAGGVALMLDCCGAPAHWAGREDLFDQGVAEVTSLWQGLGSPTLVFACPTCLSLLGPRLAGAKTTFLGQVLEDIGVPATVSPEGNRPLRVIHDPCTTRHNAAVRQSARRLLGLLAQPVEELVLSQETTECCGYGGLQANANPGLARRVAARRAAESPLEYVTYCAMCRDSLAAAGKRTVHILDLVYPGDADPAGRPRPGWSERRENRARLRERLLARLWNEGGHALQPWQSIELLMSEEVRTRLEARRIMVEDVQRVIHHAKHTGDALCHSVSGRFLASFRPRAVMFWVEYSPRGDAFEIHNAYGHRMDAEMGVK
jgi:glutamate synthase (NADPH) small chain